MIKYYKESWDDYNDNLETDNIRSINFISVMDNLIKKKNEIYNELKRTFRISAYKCLRKIDVTSESDDIESIQEDEYDISCYCMIKLCGANIILRGISKNNIFLEDRFELIIGDWSDEYNTEDFKFSDAVEDIVDYIIKNITLEILLEED